MRLRPAGRLSWEVACAWRSAADGAWRTLRLEGPACRTPRGRRHRRTHDRGAPHPSPGHDLRDPAGRQVREIMGVPQQVIDLFSRRRRAITARTSQLVAVYRRRFGREPTALELDRLQRQATFATRRAKQHTGETVEARLDRWDRELRDELAGGLRAVAEMVLARRRAQPEPARLSPSQVVAQALAAVQARHSAWRRTDLSAAVAEALPDHLGVAADDDVQRLVDGLTNRALS